MTLFGDSIPFYKMNGCGNDFIVIDNRELNLPETEMGRWAEKLCRRAFGVYADGLFFLDNPPAGTDLAYRWHFYNSDGSCGEMCGNGARCAARLAHAIGLAPAEHTFGTVAGPIRARVIEDGPRAGQVKVQLTPPENARTHLTPSVNGGPLTVHFVDTGVPHAVVFVDDIQAVDILDIGPRLRYHDMFAPAGANVDFAQIIDRHTIQLRTYERGVEAETYACGTGAAATQFLAHTLGLTDTWAELTTTGGEVLTIYLEDGDVFLQGAAELTFRGEFYLEPLGLTRMTK